MIAPLRFILVALACGGAFVSVRAASAQEPVKNDAVVKKSFDPK